MDEKTFTLHYFICLFNTQLHNEVGFDGNACPTVRNYKDKLL